MKKLIAVILLTLFCFNSAYAEEVSCPALSLQEAISIAVEKNLDMNMRRKDLGIAANNIKVANRLQNPELQTFFLFGDTSLGNPQQLGLVFPIEIMKRGARKKLAQSRETLIKKAVGSDLFELKMDVRSAYVDYASAKSILKIVEKQQHYLEEMVSIARKRAGVGVSAEVEVMQADIILEQLVTIHNKAQNQVAVNKYNFNKTINSQDEELNYDINLTELPQNGDFLCLCTPNPKTQIPTYDFIEKLAFEHRYDIKIAQSELDVAKKNLVVVARQKVPDIRILGGYMFLSDWQNNDLTISNGGPLSGAYAGLNIDLPVLYRFRPEIRNAKIEIEQKELNLKSVENQARQDLKMAYNNLLVAQKNLNYYTDELLKNSTSVLKSSKRSYEVGKSDLSDLIIIQQANMNILMGYTLTLAEYYSCWVDLLREICVEAL